MDVFQSEYLPETVTDAIDANFSIRTVKPLDFDCDEYASIVDMHAEVKPVYFKNSECGVYLPFLEISLNLIEDSNFDVSLITFEEEKLGEKPDIDFVTCGCIIIQSGEYTRNYLGGLNRGSCSCSYCTAEEMNNAVYPETMELSVEQPYTTDPVKTKTI
ncbi:MAG: hypothetical protein J7K00_04000 [Candidatus Diapherotrites archaeon]|nr:hypothetical protein [Candidatus Diapherotrites archaeon]